MNISDYTDAQVIEQVEREKLLEIPTYMREAAQKELQEAQELFQDEGDIAVEEAEERQERLEANWVGFLGQIAESGV